MSDEARLSNLTPEELADEFYHDEDDGKRLLARELFRALRIIAAEAYWDEDEDY